jgi:hypothetical protein
MIMPVPQKNQDECDDNANGNTHESPLLNVRNPEKQTAYQKPMSLDGLFYNKNIACRFYL